MMLTRFVYDLRDSLRSIQRRPVSSVAAIATLAIGIGLNAAVFAVFDWVLLRPLPFPSAHELVRVFTAGAQPLTSPEDVTHSEFLAVARAGALRAATAVSTVTRVITAAGVEPSHVVVARVSGDLFATLGIYPEIGRGFDAGEAAAGAPVIVISADLWRSRFGSDSAGIGQPVTIDGQTYTLVGVMPERRSYPTGVDVWRPITRDEYEDDDRENVMIARLAAGISSDRATAEVGALTTSLTAGERTAWVEDVHRTDVRDVRGALTALVASAALLLLMACANMAALLGGRAADRTGEMAVRAALGASRHRLLRQLLIEHLLLALAGGFVGVLLGRWALDVLIVAAPAQLPRLGEITLDGRVVAVATLTTFVVGGLVALLSSTRASRFDLRAGLGATTARTSRRTSGRGFVVAVQTSVAVLLVVTAGLLARSLQHLVSIDHGFRPDHLLAVDLNLRGGVPADVRQFFRNIVAEGESVPGVRSAAVTLRLPTQLLGLRVPIGIIGFTGDAPRVTLRPITPRYFETVGIPLLDGRVFTDDDRQKSAHVTIANQAFVQDVLGGGRALGTTVTTELVNQPLTVVGIVANVTPAGEADRPALYVPLDQIAIAGGALVVQTTGPPESVTAALRTRLRRIAPTLALDRMYPVNDALAAGRAVSRFNAQLAAAFAVLAIVLAAIGVYGLIASEVALRWRELAVRLALGAPRRIALWAVMQPAARAIAVGVAAGVAATLVVARWLMPLLHGVSALDPATLVAVPVIIVAVGGMAALVAARRVLAADPAEALRSE